ncbi:GNAT family N-acetyltransferase [Pseudoalteromonas luteoviolacea]|uniref:GNAT family N-acetyltransferase n=1 Tax=Pseudoalteromonas luteoviolacea TaxID=43657 RepID=UPI001B36E943|nr:GNAT family N-acetyltransferase [Pseudoalteromonas luteoviolacea]MBQ4812244.1 GNAT family N-acetyltransferase [Pseudoalteromonas luteoviolacea]
MLVKPILKQPIELKTKRLRLRQWYECDKTAFAAINADAEVMRYFPSVLTRHESDVLADKIARLIIENGYGFWALTLAADGAIKSEYAASEELIGFVGLHWQTQINPDQPFMEIGWRLARKYWGKGYACEAAQAALQFAFEVLRLAEVYAFTALPNMPSQKLMTRLGMKDCKQHFSHPNLPAGHPLQAHCLFRVTPEELISRT